MRQDLSRFPRLKIASVVAKKLGEVTHEEALAAGHAGYGWVASSPYIHGPHTDAGELPIEEMEREWTRHHRRAWNPDEWAWVTRVEVQA